MNKVSIRSDGLVVKAKVEMDHEGETWAVEVESDGGCVDWARLLAFLAPTDELQSLLNRIAEDRALVNNIDAQRSLIDASDARQLRNDLAQKGIA